MVMVKSNENDKIESNVTCVCRAQTSKLIDVFLLKTDLQYISESPYLKAESPQRLECVNNGITLLLCRYYLYPNFLLLFQ